MVHGHKDLCPNLKDNIDEKFEEKKFANFELTMKLRNQNHEENCSSTSSNSPNKPKIDNVTKKLVALYDKKLQPATVDDIQDGSSSPSIKTNVKVEQSNNHNETLQSDRDSASADGLEKSKSDCAKVKIDVDFEDTDEEEENVVLKNLVENLEKGDEDAKKSKALIDDLMCDINKDLSGEINDSSQSVASEEIKNKSRKREAEDACPVKQKCPKLSEKNSEVVKVITASTQSLTQLSEVKKVEVLDSIKRLSMDISSSSTSDTETVSNKGSVSKSPKSSDDDNQLTLRIDDDDEDDIQEIPKESANSSKNTGANINGMDVKEEAKCASKSGEESIAHTSKNNASVSVTSSAEVKKSYELCKEKSSTNGEKVYKLTKEELDTLVLVKVTEYFNDGKKSEIGAIRKRCEQLEEMLDEWRKKAAFYQKQVTEFQIAVQRMQSKRQSYGPRPPMRSVGLQVQLLKDTPKPLTHGAVPVGGKHTVLLPSGNSKPNTLVLPKQNTNGQMAFITNLGTHGALSNASVLTAVKNSSPNLPSSKPHQSLTNGSSNVSILHNKLTSPNSNSIVISSSASPIPMRLVQNQAIRTSPNSTTVSSTLSTSSITVSVVNQPSGSTAVKLIDLTGEEEEAAKAASNVKRVMAKTITPTTLTTALSTGLTVVPALNTSSNTLTVINPSNGGQLIALNPNGSGTGVTTAIRGPTATPVVTSTPMRLAYLMQTGPGVMTLRPTSGQPVFVAPTNQIRPTQSGTQLRPSIPATFVIRQGTTILPIQNSQMQTGQVRPVQANKIVTTATQPVTNSPGTKDSVSKLNAAKTITPNITISSTMPKTTVVATAKHPAPLPNHRVVYNEVPGKKLVPPKPALKISKADTGIVLSWNMSTSEAYATISSYQLYAYQETSALPSPSLWKKVGDVKALPLPMACTLTQFMEGHKYYFAVRACDMYGRLGSFSEPGSITLINNSLLGKPSSKK